MSIVEEESKTGWPSSEEFDSSFKLIPDNASKCITITHTDSSNRKSFSRRHLLALVVVLVILILFLFTPQPNFHQTPLFFLCKSPESSALFIYFFCAQNIPINHQNILQLAPAQRPTVVNTKCSHYSCFDIYKCGMINYNPYELPKLLKNDVREVIKVYVYPPDNHQQVSVEFSRMLNAILNSQYYTSNPNEACLLVPSIDLLNLSQNSLLEKLWSLWDFATSNGTNHLIFSMIFARNCTRISENTGKALIAGGGFDYSDYRTNYDISIPVYSIYSQIYEGENFQPLHYDQPRIASLSRKWILIGTQFDSLIFETQYYLTRLESIYSNKILLLGSNCTTGSGHLQKSQFKLKTNQSELIQLYKRNIICNLNRKMNYRYLDVIHDSEFCLIVKTVYNGVPAISDALMAGCIPIILIDNFVLPFSERIDWSSISIRVWEHSTNELFTILQSITAERREQLRRNGLQIWNRYFRSIEVITLTTLAIINDRVYSKPKNVFIAFDRQYQELAPLSFEYFSNGYSYLAPKNVFLSTFGFTTIILTFNRLESLHKVILSVSRVPSCTKIIVVWNNPDSPPPPPPDTRWPAIVIPIEIIRTEKNRLNNRFYPYASIETEAVFAIDDDIVMLTADEIEFAYQTWREFPDRIVGFPSRLHYWNNRSHTWIYDSEWKNQISLVLTGAAFYHNVRTISVVLFESKIFFLFCSITIFSTPIRCQLPFVIG